MTAFFCVKLFEICVTGMAMLSYFSSTQELRTWVLGSAGWSWVRVRVRRAVVGLRVSRAVVGHGYR